MTLSSSDLDYINKVYKQSYCRVGPYSVGILMAYFYLKYKGDISIKPVSKTLSLSRFGNITKFLIEKFLKPFHTFQNCW